MKAAALLPLACLLFAAPAWADTVRLNVGAPLARFDDLTPGAHRYVRYSVLPSGVRMAIDIWQRTVAFAAPAPGEPMALHIVQRWDEADSKTVLIQDSWFDAKTFRPRTHVRRVEKAGKPAISGYRFEDTQVVGLADLADNVRKDFAKPLPQPSYNFEYDMELLQALPLAAGRTFDIPFYDAGIDEPGRYRFVVAGSATISGADGRPVSCWLVTADYNTGAVVSRFWFAKSGQQLIREEAAQDDGSILVKALLPPEQGDRPSPSRRPPSRRS